METETMERNETDTRGEGYLADMREAFEQMKAYTDIDNNLVDEAERRIQEMPLSVLIRDGWRTPGQDVSDDGPEEYEILLGTGGPACRIYGTLNQYGEPETAEMQWQDWFKPWERVRLSEDDQKLVMRFARQFWFDA